MGMARRGAPLIVVFALLAASCAQLQDLPTLTDEDVKGIKLAQSSKVFAADNSLITTLHGAENRTIVPLKRISPTLIDAVIAIEDARFWEHEGVDLRAIGRALLSNLSSGEIKEGGSTITQQYVKNSIIAPGETAERTLERKIDEAALSRQLEQRLSKEVILERYLNTVYFGEGAYGIQAAAKTYFGKSARKLGLKESALLAGLIRAPADYDPFINAEAAIERRNIVLGRMAALGYIDEARALKAKGQKPGLKPEVEVNRYPAAYFMDYVQRLITYDPRFEVIGETPEQREQQLFQGGLRIHTTLDLDAQAAAETAVNTVLSEKADPHGSLVAIDPRNGHVKALVGGRNWFAKRKKDPYAKLNLAIQGEPNLGCQRNAKGRCRKPFEPGPAAGTGRQAGSSFKPFALVEAIKQGVPLSKTYDGPSCINLVVPETNEPWRPCNYSDSGFGKMSLLEATVNSVNTIYAQLILEVGGPEAAETAREMGITMPLQGNPSSVLGTNEVNPLNMASAYGTLAAGGVRHSPVAITKITSASGKVLYRDRTKGAEVLDPAIAFLATKALEPVVQRGTGTRAQIGRPVAGKTGTGQDYRDAWFVGYAPQLVTAVWVGYPGGQLAMRPSCSGTLACRPTRIQVTGGSWPAEIWQLFMSRALSEEPVIDFTNPGVNLVTVTIDERTGCLADRFTPKDARVEAQFVKGAQPKESCRVKGDKVKVPDVFGFPFGDAVRILQGEGFDVNKVEQESNAYPPGRVIGQNPAGGSKAPTGSTIELIVSIAPGSGKKKNGDGNKCSNVPDVLGMKQADAQATLNDAGFDVNTYYEKESDKKQAKKRKGRVWKQSPSAGTCHDGEVNIWVNP